MSQKILHSVYRYAPAMGGVEDYVQNLMERLASRRQMSVVCTHIKNHWTGEIVSGAPRNEVLHNVEITRVPLSALKMKSYATSWPFLKAMWQSDFDIVHAHSFMYLSADYAAMVAKIKQKPLVFNPYLADEGTPSLFGRFYRRTMGEWLMRAECVVVISPFERKLLESWGYSHIKRIEEIPPGINLLEFEGIDYNAFETYGVHSEHKILCAGRVDHNKGLDVAIAAMTELCKQFKDVSLTIVGPDFGYRSELEKQVKRLALGEHVKFLGPVSRKDLCSLYTHATVLAFPTRYEAFGIVAAEAMAAQTPVVASRTAALPYVVKDEETGLLFEKDNVSDMVDKISILLKDEGLRERMGRAGLDHVKQSYDWDQAAQQLDDLYQSL